MYSGVSSPGLDLMANTVRKASGSDDNGDGLSDLARTVIKGVCCSVAVLGGLGNLLTLCAVPYASRCCRAPAEVKSLRHSTATVFILNLAVADLMYCLVNLPLYYSQYSMPQHWRKPGTENICMFVGLLRYTNAAADWMSLAGIAFNRCVCLLSLKWKGRIFGGWKSYTIIALIWMYGFLTQVLSLSKVYGSYGWNNTTHKCDFLRIGRARPRTDWFLISWSIPCAIIGICYSLIFYKVKKSGRQILRNVTQQQRRPHITSIVQTREDRTSRMIFVVFITYFICVLPITVINVADPDNHFPYLAVSFYCIYWLQYCCNNIIYVVSNVVYRKAYIIFLTAVFPPLKMFLKRPNPWQPARQTTVASITARSMSGRSFSPGSRRLTHTDSTVSQSAATVCGDTSPQSYCPDGGRESRTTSTSPPSRSSPSERLCWKGDAAVRPVGPQRHQRRYKPRVSAGLRRPPTGSLSQDSPPVGSRWPPRGRLSLDSLNVDRPNPASEITRPRVSLVDLIGRQTGAEREIRVVRHQFCGVRPSTGDGGPPPATDPGSECHHTASGSDESGSLDSSGCPDVVCSCANTNVSFPSTTLGQSNEAFVQSSEQLDPGVDKNQRHQRTSDYESHKQQYIILNSPYAGRKRSWSC